MKALMKTAKGPGHIELRDIPTPTIAGEEVLIRVVNAGVCGTDVHLQYDRFANSPPFVLGHEFSGEIAAMGEGVSGLSVGDRVVSANNPYACGRCAVCRAGSPNLCPEKRAMGIHSDGCFADYVKLPATLIHGIPENVSFAEAALMEPLAVATHAVAHRCGIRQGDSVLVFGAGAIGLLAGQVARAEGAGWVLLAGTSKDEATRFGCARELGLETVNVEKEDLSGKVMGVTDGLGVDVVVEASGSAAAIGSGLGLLKRTGRMAVSGITGKSEIPVNWDGLTAKGVSLFFCYSSVNEDWERGLSYLASKRVATGPLITHWFELGQWREAFATIERLEAIRPVFRIGSASNE